MKQNRNHLITSSLKQLDKYIITTIKGLLLSRQIVPVNRRYSFWECDDFKYTNRGVENSGSTLKYKNVYDWRRAVHTVSSGVLESIAFKDTNGLLKKLFPDAHEKSLQSYINQTIAHYFDCIVLEDFDFSDIKRRFIRDLNLQPFTVSVVKKLSGLILESENVRIDSNVIIRQAVQKDVEILREEGFCEDVDSRFSAIAEMNWIQNVEDGVSFKDREERYVILLKLFCLGSIDAISSKYHSDRIIQYSSGIGGQTYIPHTIAWKHFILRRGDENKLKLFIKKMTLPNKLYKVSREIDYLVVAFERYNDSILEITSIEDRVANAVMGIEALLSQDQQELKFRMKTRVGKLLSCFKFEGLKVSGDMGKAYDVRSAFAHGGFLKEKDKQNIINKYGKIDSFCLLIIDYLRLILIISIGCGVEKDKLIALIDDSLIDDTKTKELKKIMYSLRPFIHQSHLTENSNIVSS